MSLFPQVDGTGQGCPSSWTGYRSWGRNEHLSLSPTAKTALILPVLLRRVLELQLLIVLEQGSDVPKVSQPVSD